MNRKSAPIIFLCAMYLVGQANADYNYGFPGTRNCDLQQVMITEYSPQGRTVILKTPNELETFLEHCGGWGMNKRGMRTIERDIFLNAVPLRYQVTVNSALEGKLYTNSVIIAVIGRGAPRIQFVCVAENSKGDFTFIVEGPERTIDEPHTPFEGYMEQLFPPHISAATGSTDIPIPEHERSKPWYEAELTVSIWLLSAFSLGPACATYFALRAMGASKTKKAEQVSGGNGGQAL